MKRGNLVSECVLLTSDGVCLPGESRSIDVWSVSNVRWSFLRVCAPLSCWYNFVGVYSSYTFKAIMTLISVKPENNKLHD